MQKIKLLKSTDWALINKFKTTKATANVACYHNRDTVSSPELKLESNLSRKTETYTIKTGDLTWVVSTYNMCVFSNVFNRKVRGVDSIFQVCFYLMQPWTKCLQKVSHRLQLDEDVKREKENPQCSFLRVECEIMQLQWYKTLFPHLFSSRVLYNIFLNNCFQGWYCSETVFDWMMQDCWLCLTDNCRNLQASIKSDWLLTTG